MNWNAGNTGRIKRYFTYFLSLSPPSPSIKGVSHYRYIIVVCYLLSFIKKKVVLTRRDQNLSLCTTYDDWFSLLCVRSICVCSSLLSCITFKRCLYVTIYSSSYFLDYDDTARVFNDLFMLHIF